MMLAEVTNFSPPMEIAAWLACCAFAIWFMLLCDKGIQRVRGKLPQPPNEQLESDHRDLKRRVKVLEDWKSQLIEKMDEDKTAVIAAGEIRAIDIHAHIERDRIEIQSQLNALPAQIITILKNTGAIGK